MTKLTDRRIAYLCRQAEKGWEGDTLAQMAARWGVTPRCLRGYVHRYRETHIVPTLNPNRRPKGPPLSLGEKQLIDAARAETGRGASKIYAYLGKHETPIPKHKIHAYCKMKGYSTPNPRKQKKRSRCRYERAHTGSLLHGDWHRKTIDSPHVILWEDDASRVIFGGGEFPEENAILSVKTFHEAVANAATWNVLVREVNTDRGSVFYNNKKHPNPRGDELFAEALAQHGIRHIPSRVNNPQTNGKVERIWFEYDRHRHRFSTLIEWIAWYNRQTHDSLWTELYETPEEAVQRKLPPESIVGLFLSLAQERDPYGFK